MIDASCSWDHPGANRYTGSAEQAIHAYAEIPRPTQDRLIARFNARQFDDFVFISRAGIHGKSANYGSTVQRMHFGSQGRLCDSVSIDGWEDSHVETAIVVCADGWCLAAPTVCSNWFILGPRVEDERPPADVPMPAVPAIAGAPGLVPLTYEAPTALGVPTFEQAYEGGSYGGYGGPGGGGWYGGGGGVVGGAPCAFCVPVCDAPVVPTPIAPVPEPATYALLAAGLIALSRMVRRRGRR